MTARVAHANLAPEQSAPGGSTVRRPVSDHGDQPDPLDGLVWCTCDSGACDRHPDEG